MCVVIRHVNRDKSAICICFRLMCLRCVATHHKLKLHCMEMRVHAIDRDVYDCQSYIRLLYRTEWASIPDVVLVVLVLLEDYVRGDNH